MYPGGMCSIVCSSQSDCPSGSVCVTEGGGRCLLACASASDCRDGYNCVQKSIPEGGERRVCLR